MIETAATPLTLRALRAELQKCPTDPLARMALADWFEENGDLDRAECHRWLLVNDKQPEPWYPTNDKKFIGYGGWTNYANPSWKKHYKISSLPDQLWAQIQLVESGHFSSGPYVRKSQFWAEWIRPDGRTLAWIAVEDAWVRLKALGGSV